MKINLFGLDGETLTTLISTAFCMGIWLWRIWQERYTNPAYALDLMVTIKFHIFLAWAVLVCNILWFLRKLVDLLQNFNFNNQLQLFCTVLIVWLFIFRLHHLYNAKKTLGK